MRVVVLQLIHVSALGHYVTPGTAMDYPEGEALQILINAGVVRPADETDQAQIATEGALQVETAGELPAPAPELPAADQAPELPAELGPVLVTEAGPVPQAQADQAPSDPSGRGALQYADQADPEPVTPKAPIRRKQG